MSASGKIMVVDDERGIRYLLEDALVGEGYDVTLAKNGRDCLRQMEEQEFDVLITDMDMPELDGMGLLRMMKRAGRAEMVIVMSGHDLNEGRFHAPDLPPVLCRLQKPFKMEGLLNVIVRAMENQYGDLSARNRMSG